MGFSLTERTFGPGSLSKSSFAPSIAVAYFLSWIYSPLGSHNQEDEAAIISIV